VQRWWVAPFFLVLVPALAELPRTPPGSLGRAATIVAVAGPAAFSLFWIWDRVPAGLKRDHLSQDPAWPDVKTIQCRDDAGARLGDRVEPTYVESQIFWLYSTCRPLYVPGALGTTWPVNVFPRIEPFDELRRLDAMIPRTASLPTICKGSSSKDPVCARASSCVPDGRLFARCELTPDARQRLVPP
jgi:hypothetical protein